MMADADRDEKVDQVFIIYTTIICVAIWFAAICGCINGYLKDKLFSIFYIMLAITMFIFLMFMGLGFLAIKKMGDDICIITNDPKMREEVPDL